MGDQTSLVLVLHAVDSGGARRPLKLSPIISVRCLPQEAFGDRAAVGLRMVEKGDLWDMFSAGEIVQILPSPSPDLVARFVGNNQPVADCPVVCLALIKYPDGQSLEGIVVVRGEFKLASQVGSLLGYFDGRNQFSDVNWNERATAWHQAHPNQVGAEVLVYSDTPED